MILGRIGALFVKEIQDMRSNTSQLAMLLIPPLMTFLYKGVLNMPADSSFTIGCLFAIVMTGIYSPSMMIAEEKEKHTLRVLMLSPATPFEVFASKGLVTLLIVFLLALLMLPVAGVSVGTPLLFVLTILIGTIFVILLGFIIGLLSANQMATGYIGMPVYLVLLMVPMLGQATPSLAKLAKVVPSNYIGDGIYEALQGAPLGDGLLELGVLAGAAIVALVLLIIFYRRRELAE